MSSFFHAMWTEGHLDECTSMYECRSALRYRQPHNFFNKWTQKQLQFYSHWSNIEEHSVLYIIMLVISWQIMYHLEGEYVIDLKNNVEIPGIMFKNTCHFTLCKSLCNKYTLTTTILNKIICNKISKLAFYLPYVFEFERYWNAHVWGLVRLKPVTIYHCPSSIIHCWIHIKINCNTVSLHSYCTGTVLHRSSVLFLSSSHWVPTQLLKQSSCDLVIY